jgi:predicted thioredoxin/glutaredoxin
MSLEVKILKSSCCTTGNEITEKLKDASANADVDIHLETLSDLQETMKYGVMNFPSIVIEGEVYNYDNLNDSQDLEQILKEHSNQ